MVFYFSGGAILLTKKPEGTAELLGPSGQKVFQARSACGHYRERNVEADASSGRGRRGRAGAQGVGGGVSWIGFIFSSVFCRYSLTSGCFTDYRAGIHNQSQPHT